MSAPGEGGEETTSPPPPPPTIMASSPPSTAATAQVRHYPLDLPSGLPFDRYEHRRLTARDILVHRIMAAILTPSTPSLSHALSFVRKNEPKPKFDARCCMYHRKRSQTQTIPHHNFGPLRQHGDACLARDVEVLRKMLVTRSEREWTSQAIIDPPPEKSHYRQRRDGVSLVPVPASAPPSLDGPIIEEELLDLVRRHYMETDDACTRLWLGAVQTAAQPSTYETLSKMPGKRDSQRESVQGRRRWEESNAIEDYKKWYDEDKAHLKALQAQTRVAGEYRLYEGGAFVPALRKPLLATKVERTKFTQTMATHAQRGFFAVEEDAQKVQTETWPWPEPGAPRRVSHIPSWYSWRQKRLLFNGIYVDLPSLDFASGRMGRGLDRDGIWSTGKWYGDNMPRGRTMRRGRRRATSEPPPGLFTAARLPASFNSSREVLIFPKMTLATMDRRARRRSLSRTRIAEQFNWDVVVDMPPTPRPAWNPKLACCRCCLHAKVGPLVEGRISDEKTRRSMEWSASRIRSGVYRTDVETTKQRYSMLYREVVDQYRRGLLTLSDVADIAWVGAKFITNRAFPPWWLDLDGPTGIAFLEADNPEPIPPCLNCSSNSHFTANCRAPCGHCGAPNPNTDYSALGSRRYRPERTRYILTASEESSDSDEPSQAGRHHNPHLASDCLVAPKNRCKCAPFPQFHVAAKCPVLCSRDCGVGEYPPGHFKHKNAMGCKGRCCMCGMRGHSGTRCKLRRCRCGGQHLGQDCDWHPECRVEGCDRFLCGVHCRGCGVDRGTLGEGEGFVGGRCAACLGAQNGGLAASETASEAAEPVSEDEGARDGPQETPPAAQPGRRAKRKNKRKHRDDAAQPPKQEKPWYAPLEPRTKAPGPSKSGKKGTWKRPGPDKELPVRIGGCR